MDLDFHVSFHIKMANLDFNYWREVSCFVFVLEDQRTNKNASSH